MTGLLKVRDKEIEIGKRTYIMGILNMTPDSFSDGGKYNTLEKGMERVLKMIEDGADIIDVGGESSRPGYKPVTAEEELRRINDIVKKLREVNTIVSVDTMKSKVAEESLKNGAHIINDIWGLQRDPDMAKVVADYGAGVVIMHNKDVAEYDDVLKDVISFLEKSIDIALKAGIKEENIMIDPGIGFGKTLEHNLTLMKRLDELKVLGFPILLGTSRKSMIGHVLKLDVNERVEGTAATVAIGISKGADIVRVHDVKEMARVAKMTDAMVR
ncbi:dihydropteroate synthase [Thermoanaerobacterium thermosaccharolyticum]|jgi:dihydropteroate synthase|uniref:Dihydropteroate synthase n=1 Tax=Thermoanaerobacterium thermosaccharolyticum TaxID=1517 RepID=A0A231VJF2_THETR|nr:dihydropteroate synthase [Thermoanaerobacterium thermosaccharolyticum]AST57824.1 dihydropteroate synthase [Thermoanaerobacterium thermosaccharolyticum]OXT08294.1 dihydropteroate synthase [Thermoanaerobacterium thermosaccharolyticum]TCW42480.1 dihydropteroate synthase [Thermohydrogenium kirishiense]